MVVIRWKDIFDCLESAIDACETVAHVLEGIEIKRGALSGSAREAPVPVRWAARRSPPEVTYPRRAAPPCPTPAVPLPS